jgi:two-component system NarL family sensor kinase
MNQLLKSSVYFLKYGIFFLISCQEPAQRDVSTGVSAIETYSIRTSADTADIDDQIMGAIKLWDKNPDSAKMLFRDAAQKSASQNYYKGYAVACSNLGSRYRESADYDSSIYYLKRGLAAAHKLPYSDYSAVIYACMGAVHYDQSRFDTAAVYMYKALESLESGPIRNYKYACKVYNTVGGFWLNNGNLENALPYFDKAEKLALTHKDSALATDAQCTKGTIYFRKGSLDTAIFYYSQVLNSDYANDQNLSNASLNMGTIYMRPQNKNLPQKSVPYYQEAIRLSKSQSDIAVAKVYLGAAYIQLKEYDKAESLLFDAVENSADVGLGEDVVNAHQNLAAAYYHNKKYKLAFDQLFKALSLNDSTFKKDNLEMMGKLEVKYQLAKKDKELAQKRLQISYQQSQIKERNLWIGGIASGGLLLSGLLISLLKNHKRKEEIARLKSIMQGEEKERARIAHELHDGIISELSAVKMHFSAIEYQVKDHVASPDFREAMKQLEETTEELRKTSHNLMPEILIQSGITIAVHSFCEKLRKSTAIPIDFQSYGEIPRMNREFELTVFRIIQELVQNILKHAQASQILVQLSCEDSLLTITVEDNGKGIPEKPQSDTGMGLKNIKTRVKALGGQITIDTGTDTGTSVFIEFTTSDHTPGL